jgi:hypothetical protein
MVVVIVWALVAGSTTDEERKGRWFHYGEPWGFFKKTRPTATGWSVVRSAFLYGLTFPWLYVALIYFREEPTPDWQWKLAGCAVVFGLLGALFEWQGDFDGPPEDLDIPQ